MQSDDLKRPSSETSRSCIALIVPKRLVKKIKDVLQAHGDLDKSLKIRPATLEDLVNLAETLTETLPGAVFIPTKLSVRTVQADSDALLLKGHLLRSFGLVEWKKDIEIIAFQRAHDVHGSETSSVNLLARTIDRWLHRLPPEQHNWAFAEQVMLSYNWTYMVYPPLLLLPPSTLSNLMSVFASQGQDLPEGLSPLWHLLSKEFKVSNIALNAPIPASASTEVSVQDGRYPKANVLRSPTGLVPLYGDFGPTLPLNHIPTVPDFSSAFWCTAQQNRIFQTWAPRYTMFSRGNISEKSRILGLRALTKNQLGSQPEETSTVDLYAGVGYFAFSYARAGVGKVLCWEINPWSVEGLRRGAKRNGWGVEVIKEGQASIQTINSEQRFIVFQESNEHAARTVASMRDSIPPIRHVNCGLLPSSKDSWEVAVQVLDPIGGWIHAHENIAKADIESRKEEVVETFMRLVKKHWSQGREVQWEVKCEHVEQVKSYAPGVVHCVLDVSVLLTGFASEESPLAPLDLSAHMTRYGAVGGQRSLNIRQA